MLAALIPALPTIALRLISAWNGANATAANEAIADRQAKRDERIAKTNLRITQVGVWYEPEHLFGYVMVGYFAKLVLWDKVIGSFAGYTDNVFQTDPLRGDALAWGSGIMAFYFGTKLIARLARR